MNQPPTFLELIDRLTKESSGQVKRDTGAEVRSRPALLVQLRQAVFGGWESAGASTGFKSRPPIDAGAYDLLAEIEAQATEALAAVDHRPTPLGTAEEYVKQWSEKTTDHERFTVSTRVTEPNADEFINQFVKDNPGQRVPPTVYTDRTEYTAYKLAERWVSRIEDFFDALSKPIDAACPHCGVKDVYRMKDGERVKAAALNIYRDRDTDQYYEVRCSAWNCGVSWGRHQFEYLAKLIGAAPVPELQEHPA